MRGPANSRVGMQWPRGCRGWVKRAWSISVVSRETVPHYGDMQKRIVVCHRMAKKFSVTGRFLPVTKIFIVKSLTCGFGRRMPLGPAFLAHGPRKAVFGASGAPVIPAGAPLGRDRRYVAAFRNDDIASGRGSCGRKPGWDVRAGRSPRMPCAPLPAFRQSAPRCARWTGSRLRTRWARGTRRVPACRGRSA